MAIFHFEKKKNYPQLIVKRLLLTNSVTKDQIRLKKSKFNLKSSPIKAIILDTGAEYSSFPLSVKSRLKLHFDDEYNVVQTPSGIGFYQRAFNPIEVEITDDNNNTIKNEVIPTFITKIVPNVQINSSPLIENKIYVLSEDEISDLDIIVSNKSRYSAYVKSKENLNFLKSRFAIKKYNFVEELLADPKDILLGRDWQEDFLISFQKNLVKIQ